MTAIVFPRRTKPSFVGANINGFVHEVGVWGLFVEGVKLDSQFPRSISWVASLIHMASQSFPWVRFRDMEIGISNANHPVHWRANGETLIGWIRNQAESGSMCGGLTANLDLDLCWVAPDRTVGESTFEMAGRLLVDPQLSSSSPEEIYCSFSIGVNLFTDTIWSDEGAGCMDISIAARTNRQRLEQSLRSWEAITRGEIREWESMLVKGVCRYGISDAATEL